MRATRQDLPETVGIEDDTGRRVIMQSVEMGDMQGAFYFFPKGVDISGLFTKLDHGKCPEPHWGYVLRGRMRLQTVDQEEVYAAGDLFYWPPYHMPFFDEDTEFLEFSPVQAVHDLMARLEASQ
jgi:hypothetical protein